jgi:hypothetical protein
MRRLKNHGAIHLAVALLWTLIIGMGFKMALPAAAANRESAVIPRVNAPFFDGNVRFSEMTVFWFGQVDDTNNYADVRVGYNQDNLRIRIATFDRYLWYDKAAGPDLTAWDSATIYLGLDGGSSSGPTQDQYRIDMALNWWESEDAYQIVYRGNGTAWEPVSVPFTGTTAWRGNAPNDDVTGDDRGWTADLYVPFSSLGLSDPPAPGTVWRMAVVVHDRDDAAGAPIDDKSWPPAMSPSRSDSWGELAFGVPEYTRPAATPGGVVTVRNNLDGARVMDASVGGHTVCGDGVDFWLEWGNTNEGFYNPDRTQFNIQNQGDVADWPCYSKYYVTFPLDAVPPGKAIISATLTLHQFGNAGAPGEAKPSYVQVFTVNDAWDDTTITWNNAPLATENITGTWVDPVTTFPGWPGIPWDWDVSRAVANAYANQSPLRLALYEADGAYHSGKYFVSSEAGDWNAAARPTLRVWWGDAAGTVEKSVSPKIVSPGMQVTYVVTVTGNGSALTLTDELPDGVAAPLAQSPDLTYTPHQLSWSGAPAVGRKVSLSYVVTVTAPSHTMLVNRAILRQGDGSTHTATASVLVDPVQIFLPLTLRNASN